MKNFMKFIFSVIAILTFSFSAFSQKVLKKADAAFEARQYFSAINLYKQAYSSVPKDKKASVLFKMGVASQSINDYKGAEANFQKAIAANFDNPDVYFHLAEVLKSQMKYPEAIVEYNNYKAKGGNAKRADLGVKSAQLAQQWVDSPMRYKIENVALINSKQKDFAPAYSDKKYQSIIFTSNRDGALGGQEINTGGNHYDIFETKLAKNGKWSTPMILPPSVSSPVNEGSAWISKRGDLLFFTRCPEEKNKENKCGLYMCKKQGSTWGNAEPLPFVIDTIAFGHPCLTADGKTLYFTSKLNGGYGGTDIWFCTYDAKSNAWGQPKNCGPMVNTVGNESYPTVTDDGRKLYFSSDYHPGLGGLDIFVTEISANGKFDKPVENLKYPLNSSYDDFGIVFEGKKNKGFFSSNREGGKGDDDIYSFYLQPLVFNVRGNIFSEGDPTTGKGKGEQVENVKVKVIGSDGSISEVSTGKDGSFKFKIKERNTYTISTETSNSSKSSSHNKDGFLSNTDARIISTVGEAASKDFVADFAVKPIVPNPRMPVVLYELGSPALLPSSKDSLNYLYNIMKDNPSTVVELNAHTDTRGSAASNMTLSAARAQSCVDYLVKEKGINPKRLIAKGYGATMPIISDEVIKKAASQQEKEALHEKNRRTSFKILSFDFVDPDAPKTKAKPAKKADDDDDEDEE
jgi:peptidoglycan-associated lipoprotein